MNKYRFYGSKWELMMRESNLPLRAQATQKVAEINEDEGLVLKQLMKHAACSSALPFAPVTFSCLRASWSDRTAPIYCQEQGRGKHNQPPASRPPSSNKPPIGSHMHTSTATALPITCAALLTFTTDVKYAMDEAFMHVITPAHWFYLPPVVSPKPCSQWALVYVQRKNMHFLKPARVHRRPELFP